MSSVVEHVTASVPVVTGSWLVRFRWAVLAGSAVLLMGSAAAGMAVPADITTAILLVQAASNAWLSRRFRGSAASSVHTLGAIVLLDVTLLTALLAVTGAASNPFTVAYLVYVTLAAVSLDVRWTWVVTAACTAGYAALFAVPGSAPEAHAAHVAGAAQTVHAAQAMTDPMPGHVTGMWIAFIVAAVLTASFVWRGRVALESRERALGDARRGALERERLAALTTLAAGAAKELGTPLATIAVAVRELERAVVGGPAHQPVAGDARLIRDQVYRCRVILDHMSGRADGTVADPAVAVLPANAVAAAIALCPAGTAARVTTDVGPGPPVAPRPTAPGPCAASPAKRPCRAPTLSQGP